MTYFFNLGEGHLSEQACQAAEAAGARVVNHVEPNGRRRHWCEVPNRGSPWNEQAAARVMAAIEALGEAAYLRLPEQVQAGQPDEDVLPLVELTFEAARGYDAWARNLANWLYDSGHLPCHVPDERAYVAADGWLVVYVDLPMGRKECHIPPAGWRWKPGRGPIVV